MNTHFGCLDVWLPWVFYIRENTEWRRSRKYPQSPWLLQTDNSFRALLRMGRGSASEVVREWDKASPMYADDYLHDNNHPTLSPLLILPLLQIKPQASLTTTFWPPSLPPRYKHCPLRHHPYLHPNYNSNPRHHRTDRLCPGGREVGDGLLLEGVHGHHGILRTSELGCVDKNLCRTEHVKKKKRADSFTHNWRPVWIGVYNFLQ